MRPWILAFGILALLVWQRRANASQAPAMLLQFDPMTGQQFLAPAFDTTAPDTGAPVDTSFIPQPQASYAENATLPTPAYTPELMTVPAANAATQASQSAIDRLKSIEGFSPVPYPDPAGQSRTWSIGYGYQIRNGEKFTRITEPEADALLRKVIAEDEAIINSSVTVPLSQNQFDAVTMFLYNIGATQWRGSTLLRKLNAGDYSGAANEFPRWIRAGNTILPTLQARRANERALFLTA